MKYTLFYGLMTVSLQLTSGKHITLLAEMGIRVYFEMANTA